MCRTEGGIAVICLLRWPLKQERVFVNLCSYLIWNECHSHSLLVTETGVNMKAKWTNTWLVCALLCLQGLSVLLLIRLIMHPESILQHTADWSWCVHVSVCLPVSVLCVVYSSRATDTSSCEIHACHGDRLHRKNKLCSVKIPFVVKVQAIDSNITANKDHFI